MTELEKDLQAALAEAQELLAAVTDEQQLEECRVRFLGRKGLLPGLMRRMGGLSPEDLQPRKLHPPARTILWLRASALGCISSRLTAR